MEKILKKKLRLIQNITGSEDFFEMEVLHFKQIKIT